MKRHINLLPPAEQKNLKNHRLGIQIRDFGIWLNTSFLILTMLLLVTRFVLNEQLKNTTERTATAAAQLAQLENTDLRDEIVTINRGTRNLAVLKQSHQDWSPILRELASLLPADMTIDNIQVNRETREILLSGKAGSRASVLQYRQNIIASDMFEKINFPLANLESAVNSEWSYRFYYLEEGL